MPSKKVTDLTELATGASGDKFLVVDVSDTTDGASGTSKWIDWDNLPAGGGGSGDLWSDPVDADIVPDADGTRDLGSSANRFAETHTDSLDINGATVTAILDEDDMSSDSASALATQQSIKAYVDAQSGGSDTNVYGFHYADTGTSSKFFVSDTLTEIGGGQNDYRCVIGMPKAGSVTTAVLTGSPTLSDTLYLEVWVNGTRTYTASATVVSKGSLNQATFTFSSSTYSASDYLSFAISGNGTGGNVPNSIGSCQLNVMVTNS